MACRLQCETVLAEDMVLFAVRLTDGRCVVEGCPVWGRVEGLHESITQLKVLRRWMCVSN